MDLEKWKEYENKEKDLRGKFRKKRFAVLAIWLVIAIIVNGGLLLFKAKISVSVMITIMAFFNIISIFVFLKKIAELYNIEKKQVEFVEQDEPFGRFRT